jgi:hypothetical protein
MKRIMRISLPLAFALLVVSEPGSAQSVQQEITPPSAATSVDSLNEAVIVGLVRSGWFKHP